MRAVILSGIAAVLSATLVSAQQPHAVTQTSGVKATLQAVSAVSEKVVWASGSGGMVLRTVDGGDSWEQHPVTEAAKLEFRGLHAISDNEAWAMSIGNGDASRIYHTSNGGAVWTEQFRNTDSTAFFDCITFFDAKHGAAYSDASSKGTTIIHTADGGEHWTLVPSTDVPAGLAKEGGFASSNSCLVRADNKHGFIAAGTPGARLFGTSNAGLTWNWIGSVPLVHDASSGLTAISFRDAKHGIAVGGRVAGQMTRDTSSPAVATTDDGGLNWTVRHRPTEPGMLSGVALVPGASNKAAVIASYSGVYYSLDGGDSWTSAASGYFWAARAAGKRAWIVGRNGLITRLDF